MKAYITIYRTESGLLYAGTIYDSRESADRYHGEEQFVTVAEIDIPNSNAEMVCSCRQTIINVPLGNKRQWEHLDFTARHVDGTPATPIEPFVRRKQ